MGGRPLALSFSHRVYRLLMRAISPLAMGWLWWRGRKDSGYRDNLGHRRGFIEPTPSSLDGLLIHAASVGEVQAAQPLIAALREHWPQHTITVTTQTPTGMRALHSQWGDALQHLYFPADTPGATARFLDRLQPRLVILIEREVWPEWLLQCHGRAIPVALVNARLSEKSAANYLRFNGLMQPAWQGLALTAAADEESAKRLSNLGVPANKSLLTGNLKFDHRPEHCVETTQRLPQMQRPVLVAGSTHEGEESALLDAWPVFLHQHADALLVLVPRHPERFDAIAREIAARGLQFARRGLGEAPGATTSVWLGDTMGELSAWYAMADVCFIGGTLVPVGGHNPLEAMAVGKPVLFGPYTENAAALYDAIADGKAGERVESAAMVLKTAAQWLAAPEFLSQMSHAALALVETQQGGSQSTLRALERLWQPLQPALLGRIAVVQNGPSSIWYNPALLDTDSLRDIFSPSEATTTPLATGSGRGQAKRMLVGDLEVVLRHYRRGGLVARFNPDRYRLRPARESRAMREYAVLRWMRARGLPVPAPVAARQQVSGRSYTADIIVQMIPGTQNLVQRLSSSHLNEDQWRAVGDAIRQLHNAQVFHSDLNAHNILLDDNGRAWVVDFDKCETRSGGQWKTENLQRLKRSLRKESVRLAHFHWKPSDEALLMAGYMETPDQPSS